MGKGEMVNDYIIYMDFWGGDRNVLEVMAAQHCECAKCHCIVCFKMVNIM